MCFWCIAADKMQSVLLIVQVYVSKEVAAASGGFGALTSSGTSILVQGLLRETPPGTLQVCSSCFIVTYIVWTGQSPYVFTHVF